MRRQLVAEGVLTKIGSKFFGCESAIEEWLQTAQTAEPGTDTTTEAAEAE